MSTDIFTKDFFKFSLKFVNEKFTQRLTLVWKGDIVRGK